MTDLSTLLLTIYRKAQELPTAEFQDSVLCLVKSAIQFDSCAWSVAKITDNGPVFHTIHLHQELVGRSGAYEEIKHLDTAAKNAFNNLGTTVNCHAPTLFAGDKNTGIREYAHTYKHQNDLITLSPYMDSDLVHSLAVYRANPDHQFSEAERALCQELAPHCMEALRINRILNIHRHEQISQKASHAAYADKLGFIHHADIEFIQMLSGEWPDWNKTFLPPAVLTWLSSGAQEHLHCNTLVLDRKVIQDLVVILARPKVSADRLTPRELEVATLAARGLSHKEIAKVLFLSPATVRNHLQHIHDRLEIHSRAELVMALKEASF